MRKRWVVGAYKAGLRNGAYWGIRTNIADYGLATAMNCPLPKTTILADTPTRLKQMDGCLQRRVINWGYAVCDAAMRKHVDPAGGVPGDFPFSGGVG